MRRAIVFLLAVTLLAFAAPALAQNPHFLPGSPTFEVVGNQVRAFGSIAGVGNQPLTVVLTAQGTATVVCTNPGGNVAPGQTQQVTLQGEQRNIHPEHGRANFDVATGDLGKPPADACPNRKWKASFQDVTFTSATLEVFQGGQLVLSATHSF